jgi:hypothetical protein
MELVIRQGFLKEFGGRITAEVCFVDQVERTSRGKTPAVISLRNKDVPVVAAEDARAPEANRESLIQ